jgi:Uma2 family endonuclease
MENITLELRPLLELNEVQFEQICSRNKDLRFEKNAQGELIIMSPVGSETGWKNSSLSGQLWYWNHLKKLGKTFDSSTGFKLPNGATRSPDASWVKQERWEQLTTQEKSKFAPLIPDFAAELLSITDSWEEGDRKMQEYLENGLLLGWLIDPKNKKIAIYRPHKPVEILTNPKTLSGENILIDFVLDLEEIFS